MGMAIDVTSQADADVDKSERTSEEGCFFGLVGREGPSIST